MKTIQVKELIDKKVKYLKVDVEPRYWDDATINGVEDTEGALIPCKEGKSWKPLIDLDTGKIINWEEGKVARVHYKVCDDGEYWLLGEDYKEVLKYTGYYVPDILDTSNEGFGDYLIMNVNEKGMIENWKFEIKDWFEEA